MMTHHHHLLCPLYNHVEAHHVIIVNKHFKFHLSIIFIPNPPKLVVLIPCHFPCTPTNCVNTFVDCVNISINYAITSYDYTNIFANWIIKSTNCANTSNDCANTSIDSANAHNTLALDFVYEIPLFCNYHSMIVLSSKVLKPILFWPKNLPSILLLHCLVSMVVLQSLHLPPSYQNPFLKVHLHHVPNTLAFVVLIFEIQIPCICMVWAHSHWPT